MACGPAAGNTARSRIPDDGEGLGAIPGERGPFQRSTSDDYRLYSRHGRTLSWSIGTRSSASDSRSASWRLVISGTP